MTGDAADVMGAPFYVGIVTNVRVLLLAGAAAICLVAARVVRSRGGTSGSFLTALGLFSALLVIDDQFQLHEVILHQGLGIPQVGTYAAYAAASLAGLARYAPVLRSLPDVGVLLCGFALLGAGAFLDSLPPLDGQRDRTRAAPD